MQDLGARIDLEDTLWHDTARGWAEHCDRPEVLVYLRSVKGT